MQPNEIYLTNSLNTLLCLYRALPACQCESWCVCQPLSINVTVHISIFLSAWFSIHIVYVSVHLSIDICRLSACLPVCLSPSVSLILYYILLPYPTFSYPFLLILSYHILPCLVFLPQSIYLIYPNLPKSSKVYLSLCDSMCMCTSLFCLIYFLSYPDQ